MAGVVGRLKGMDSPVWMTAARGASGHTNGHASVRRGSSWGHHSKQREQGTGLPQRRAHMWLHSTSGQHHMHTYM